MGVVKNIFLYFSAFIPMYVLIQVKFLADIIFGNIEDGASIFTICVLVILVLLVVFGVIGLLWNIKWNRDKSVKVVIKNADNITDQHFLGYFSIFILFALSFDLTKVSMFAVFACITILVGIVYVHNKLFYINPFLNILGFSFYEITYVIDDDDTEKMAKIFYRGKLEASDKPTNVKLKNEHFSFIDKYGI